MIKTQSIGRACRIVDSGAYPFSDFQRIHKQQSFEFHLLPHILMRSVDLFEIINLSKSANYYLTMSFNLKNNNYNLA